MKPLSVMPGQSFAITHTGKVRDNNEDAYICLDEVGLWAVADGMGGHEAGELASSIVADKLGKISVQHGIEALKEVATTALNLANDELLAMAGRFKPGSAAGSTVAMLLISEDRGYACWAGDSRIYRLRDSELAQITSDHSHVQLLIDDGMLRPEDAESHPFSHLITRAVGFSEPLALQSLALEVYPNDRYLICSDGLNRVVPDHQIKQHLSARSPQDVVNALLNATLAAGAPDNVTIIVIE